MSMKWLPLNGKKEPPFATSLIIGWIGKDYFVKAQLTEINTKPTTKEYVFKDSENEYNDATHYFIPDATPKSKD